MSLLAAYVLGISTGVVLTIVGYVACDQAARYLHRKRNP